MKTIVQSSPISGYSTLRNYLKKIQLSLISLLLLACKDQQEKKEKQADLYNWSANISAPKFYPAAGSVDFEYAGASTHTTIEPGWGDTAGNYISGDKYKPVPEKVSIEYATATDSLSYKGTLQLPKEKILAIFREQSHPKQITKTIKKQIEVFPREKEDNAIENIPKPSNYFELIVGMAPGGWIRVWIRGNGDFDKVEIMKAKLPSYKDPNLNKHFGNLENWGNSTPYWQYHGIPYDAWANNEKEYNYGFKFVSKNNETKLDRSYVVSSDGWYSSFYTEDLSEHLDKITNNTWKGKIPVHLSVSWQDQQNRKYYDTNIVMPKNLKKIFEETYIADKNHTYSNFVIELEQNKLNAIVYLKTKNKMIKLLRFKGEPSSKEKQDFGDFAYAKEIEYFIP
ncbi:MULTISPECIES: DUF2931 family protein [unclassified Chryseobacterium]|uniref:DUF2931 family protein n=1 Tax=unclassified Chryseobacterium TaxID=2593645 RepID=UPI00301804DB